MSTAQNISSYCTTGFFNSVSQSKTLNHKGLNLFKLYELAAGLSADEFILSKILLNNQFDADKFLQEINFQLLDGQYFIGSADYFTGYENKSLSRSNSFSGNIAGQLSYLFHRVLPKLPGCKVLYRYITGGRGLRMSRTEVLGRLTFSGFRIEKIREEDEILYFKVRKERAPITNQKPSYGPLIPMRRMGKNGHMKTIYKLRTMHPYAEFIQGYVYEQNELAKGGKIKDDFRISEEGKVLRKYFLDEIPMLFNLLKGDIKLVGVRPLTEQYFGLYTESMRRRRKRHKPGLFPPFYSEIKRPDTLEEIMISEIRYLVQYEKHPVLTDLKYLFRIGRNLLFKKQRSQ